MPLKRIALNLFQVIDFPFSLCDVAPSLLRIAFPMSLTLTQLRFHQFVIDSKDCLLIHLGYSPYISMEVSLSFLIHVATLQS